MGKGGIVTVEDLRRMGFDENGKRLAKSPAAPVPVHHGPLLPPEYLERDLEGSIFIPGEVPSSKNSKRAVDAGVLLASKASTRYRREAKNTYIAYASTWREKVKNTPKPYRVQIFFARKTRGKYDWHNAIQIVCDMMQEHKWIDGDDVENMVPVPPLTPPYSVHNPGQPGVYIKLFQPQ